MAIPIQITRSDAELLHRLLREAEHSEYRGSAYLEKLRQELERAELVAPEEIAADIITMNARALLLDLRTNEQMELTLVYPQEADLDQGRISVLAPVGAAMLGYRVGDTFTWETPGGLRSLKVLRVLSQPEASGNYS